MSKRRPIPAGHRKYPRRPAGPAVHVPERTGRAETEVPKRWSREVPGDRRFPRG